VCVYVVCVYEYELEHRCLYFVTPFGRVCVCLCVDVYVLTLNKQTHTHSYSLPFPLSPHTNVFLSLSLYFSSQYSW
jgi:hypothetical protein